ncbi:MAG: UDP-N-acetylmuramoyl-L-alanyl-D-glutamate--2,6-diaminopimelate ligase [Endomicrobiales bacterium]|nr:UDP-N-acetylmuramoyl-L-alanyl-D-glutamate--2,6-diaminopimelate ligase [Endomicrobiales bacterium]
MKLHKILEGLEYQSFGNTDIDITGITFDSRSVNKGEAFIALPGAHTDGKNYVHDAVNKGAKAVVSDVELDVRGATLVVVSDIRYALSVISSNFYEKPDKRLHLIGITGTNGKTTITYLLEKIFNSAGLETGVIGTINYRYKDKIVNSINTTPESSTLFGILDSMAKKKVKKVVLEVSSHALALDRVSNMEFDIAVYTNLTGDHLDFHKTMNEYFSAKAKLFTSLGEGTKAFQKFAIINNDDCWSSKLIRKIKQNIKIVTYGLGNKADIQARNIKATDHNLQFCLKTPSGNENVVLPYLGIHNIYNALASVGAALSAGVSLKEIVKSLNNAPIVPGRLEKVNAGQKFTVVVDYAHTEDALKNVLMALCKIKTKRLITVFGCGGDRDRSKRPLMGAVAVKLSDFVFVTSDNPRSEEPQRIALDIEVGIRRQQKDNYQVILDREQAIASAITMAQEKDIVLIAGKGHETYQIIGDQKIHFNDTEIANKYIEKKLGSSR